MEDPADDVGLRFVDFQPGRSGAVAGQPAVAVGHPPGDDFPGAGAEQLAAAVAFGDLGPLVFGDHALHLGEQLGLRVVVDRGRVGERDLHAVPGQFVEHDDLVGVDAGQPVR